MAVENHFHTVTKIICMHYPWKHQKTTWTQKGLDLHMHNFELRVKVTLCATEKMIALPVWSLGVKKTSHLHAPFIHVHDMKK